MGLPRTLIIGNLTLDTPLLQAPMAGYGNYVFRHLLRKLGGVGLLVSEMLSARGLLCQRRRGCGLPERLWGIAEEPRPLAAQIWDNDPAVLAEAARRLIEEFHISVIDLNFGCPSRDVAGKAQSGAHLLRSPERIGELVSAVVATCRPTPVTVKIRLGPDRQTITAGEIAPIVEQAGAAALTVHGRTAADGFRGAADWEQIALVKTRLRRIPLIGNGDLKSVADVIRAFERYGVDGVMIGRGSLSRPWLFAQAAAALRGEPIPPDPHPLEQRRLLLEHFHLAVECFGPKKGTKMMRGFACQFASGRDGVREFRRAISKASRSEQFVQLVERYFPLSKSGN